jgi:flagellar hook-associated protein 3
MRVTNSAINRQYLRNLERSMTNKQKVENTISSNRQYTRASQDPIKASKALKVRKAMSEIEGYQDNLNTAKAIYENAESSIMKISELIQSTYEKLVYGANGTQGDSEDIIIGTSIKTFADEMTRLMNISVADRSLFGGTANVSTPYTIENDTVMYHGVPVNSHLFPNAFPYAGTSYADIGIGMNTQGIEVMYDEKTGMPVQLAGKRIDDQSALPITFNGAEILGCGVSDEVIKIDMSKMKEGEVYRFDVFTNNDTKDQYKTTIEFTAGATREETAKNINNALLESFDYQIFEVTTEGVVTNRIKPDFYDLEVRGTPQPEGLAEGEDSGYLTADVSSTVEGFPLNIIQLTIDAANALMSHDKLKAAQYADAIYAAQTNISLTIAEIGNREEFIEFNQERLTNNTFSLEEQQNNYEYTDLASATTAQKVMESLFNVTLQMSASVLPMSIFSFMS